jgi:type I restriction enzyme S subunit
VPVKASDRAARRGAYRYFGAQGVIDYIDDYIFDGTYLLIAEDGANLVSRVQPIAQIATGQFWVNNHAHVVASTNDISLKFLQYFMNGNSLNGAIRGTAQPKLTQADLNGLSVPVPPTAEQDRIVAAIEEQFSRLDAGAAALQRVQKNLKRMRTSVLQAAVTGRLALRSDDPTAAIRLVKQLRHEADAGGKRKTALPAIQDLDSVPDTWQVVALADMAQSIDYGTSEKTHTDAKGIPILRMGNLGWGTITYDDLKFLPRERLDLRLVLRNGDLLFNRTNSAELVGKTAVFRGYPRDISFASYLIRVRPLPSANMEWANIVLNSPLGRKYVASVRNQQVGQANVNGSKLASAPIPLPSTEEQSRIIAECERLLSVIDMLEKLAATAIDRGERLRSSVLSTAFTGDLVAQDPTDEPASELLDRIALERASLNSRKPKQGRKPRTLHEEVTA